MTAIGSPEDFRPQPQPSDPAGPIRPRVAFFGNRYSRLSERFFLELVRHSKSPDAPFDLILIDTATFDQARVRIRLRHRLVYAARRMMGHAFASPPTDWFRRREARSLPRWTPPDRQVNHPDFVSKVRDFSFSFGLVAGCDQILSQQLIAAIPRIVNFHNSLLPAYRGCNAVTWALVNREREIGYTFHTIESSDIDRGHKIHQRSIPVNPGSHPFAVYENLLDLAAQDTGSVVRHCLDSTEWPIGDPIPKGRYYSRSRFKKLLHFDPSLTVTETIHRLHVLGSLELVPRRLGLPIRVTRAAAATVPDRSARQLGIGAWMVIPPGSILVRCADGWLRLARLNWIPAIFLAWALPSMLGEHIQGTERAAHDRPS